MTKETLRSTHYRGFSVAANLKYIEIKLFIRHNNNIYPTLFILAIPPSQEKL